MLNSWWEEGSSQVFPKRPSYKKLKIRLKLLPRTLRIPLEYCADSCRIIQMSPEINSSSRVSRKSWPSKWINWWKRWPKLSLIPISKIMLINNLLSNTILKDWSSKKKTSTTKSEKSTKTWKRRWMNSLRKQPRAQMRFPSLESRSMSAKHNLNSRLTISNLR